MAIEENKLKIIRTATELFMHEGCKRVTMDSIAAQMHISKRTLYESFATKEELLLACMECAHEEIKECNHRALSQADEPLLLALSMMRNAAQTKHRYDRLLSDVNKYYPEIHDRFFQFNIDHFHQSVFKVLSEAQQKGIIRQNIDLQQAVMAMGSYIQAQHPDTIENKRAWLDAMSETGYTFLRGMLSPEAIAQYDAQEEHYKQLINNN